MSDSQDRNPVPDQAEDGAFFPSPFSLTQYVAPKTDFDGADYPNAYSGNKWKVLVISTQERYLRMADGRFFSTGNHPVEMLLPMLHLDAAGFDLAELFDPGEDVVEFGHQLLERRVIHPDAREGRDLGHCFTVY